MWCAQDVATIYSTQDKGSVLRDMRRMRGRMQCAVRVW